MTVPDHIHMRTRAEWIEALRNPVYVQTRSTMALPDDPEARENTWRQNERLGRRTFPAHDGGVVHAVTWHGPEFALAPLLWSAKRMCCLGVYASICGWEDAALFNQGEFSFENDENEDGWSYSRAELEDRWADSVFQGELMLMPDHFLNDRVELVNRWAEGTVHPPTNDAGVFPYGYAETLINLLIRVNDDIPAESDYQWPLYVLEQVEAGVRRFEVTWHRVVHRPVADITDDDAAKAELNPFGTAEIASVRGLP